MPRDAANEAKQQAQTASQNAATYGQRGAQDYGTLLPQAQSLINSPGYDPATLAAITNAGIGGVNATFGDAENKVQRNAALTKNPAGVTEGLDKLAQSKGIAGGQEAGNIQIQNQDFQNQQRMAGLNLLNSLYNTNTQGQQGMTTAGTQAIQTQANASPGWTSAFKDVLGGVGGLLQPAKA